MVKVRTCECCGHPLPSVVKPGRGKCVIPAPGVVSAGLISGKRLTERCASAMLDRAE